MKVERIKTSASVVLLGDFDPQQFLLERLIDGQALSPSNLDSARYEELLPGQVLTLRFGSWGRLRVLTDRWAFDVLEMPFIRASDFALKCLRELAPKSKVRVMGLNAQADFKFIDPAERDGVGRRLVPPSAWGRWGREVARRMDEVPPDSEGHPGAVGASLRMPKPGARQYGHLEIRWDAFDNQGPPRVLGMRMTSNDHYAPRTVDAEVSDAVLTATLLDTLSSEFDGSIESSLEIFEDIIRGDAS